jgi:putative cell wall-binding protein
LRAFPAVVIAAVVASSVVGIASPATALTTGQSTTASQVFAALTVAPDQTAIYSRSYFQTWIDANGDGCDTRAEVLIAESQVPVTKGSGCTITAGSWLSWYDGATWTNPSDVDIDHFVPLGEVWRSGAANWTPDQRRDYANDLGYDLTLVAITDNVNQSKGDRDPSGWLPPDSSQDCRYATDWVLVKYRWNLTMDSTEQTTLASLLSGTCGATVVTVPPKGTAGATSTSVQRLSGADRYATSVAVSSQFPSGVPVVYVASGANFPDALSAAPAAAHLGGPLLLTDPTSLPQSVHDEIQRLAPSKIIIVGGTGAVSDTVQSQLEALVPGQVTRVGGADRYATSKLINLGAFQNGAATAYIATGDNFPDALSASAAAGAVDGPVILVSTAPDTDLLAQLGIQKAVIAGGTGVVSTSVETTLSNTLGSSNVTRLAGADRYQTSSAVNRGSFTTSPTVYFANGTGFADALSGAALAGHDHAALYVVPGDCVPQYDLDDLTALGTTKRVLLGGTGALTSGVENLTPCLDPPTSPPPPANVVTPGAFCSPAGATGVSATGLAMVCKTSATDTRNRWRAA